MDEEDKIINAESGKKFLRYRRYDIPKPLVLEDYDTPEKMEVLNSFKQWLLDVEREYQAAKSDNHDSSAKDKDGKRSDNENL